MPEALAGALALPGLPWLVVAAALAGTVYGFAGFGAALIFMPVATAFLPPQIAVAAMATLALSSFYTVVPGAWARANRPAALAMVAVALLTIPLGLVVLRLADPVAIRWAVLGFCAVTLAALVLGWRRTGPDTVPARLAVASALGFTGGAVGVNGPILVLFHLSGNRPAEEIRADTIVVLSVTGLAVLPLMAAQGMIGARAVVLGLLLNVPYGLGSLLGRRLFRPGQEAQYRRIAYLVIGAAILMGLPIWSGPG